MMRILAVFLFGCMVFSVVALPCLAQGQSIQEAATEVDAAIRSALSGAGQVGQPTSRQLGGVEAGSTSSDSSGSDRDSNESEGGGGG